MIAAATTAGVMEHNVRHIPRLCFPLPGPLNDPPKVPATGYPRELNLALTLFSIMCLLVVLNTQDRKAVLA